MRILLLGKYGQLGWDLQRTLDPLGDLITLGREELDITEFNRIREVLREVHPKIIVNAAAYTAVDQAESEPEIAMALNGTAPGILAEEADRIGAGLIHFSTDYVFDGTKKSPYIEEDEPNPISVYGRTKLAGEKAIQLVGGPHIILRTSWLFGLQGKSFFRTVYRLVREKKEIKMVNDRTGSPTWSGWVAEVTAKILRGGGVDASGRDALAAVHSSSGLYHCAGKGQVTPYQFAMEILRSDPWQEEHIDCDIVPISSSEYPEIARRPQNASLSSRKLEGEFHLEIPSWKSQLSYCWKRMLSRQGEEWIIDG